MYIIQIKNTNGSTVIHDSAVWVESAQISREVSKFDSLTFNIYPDNPGYNQLVEFATQIKVTQLGSGKVVFDGRVITVDPDMSTDGAVMKSVTCESCMGYLCDSLQDYQAEKHYPDTTQSGLRNFLTMLLSVHNSKVEDFKKIYPGEITLQTFDTSGGVTKAVDRASTWDNIEDKLIGSFCGEMRVRRGVDQLLYLDYAEHLGTTRATRIEISKNMESASTSADPANVITRFYPYGAKLTETVQDEDGNDVEQETEKRLTIESVNDGKSYIDDTVAMAKFGIIEGFNEWDDVTVASNLLSKAQAWLGQNNALPVSHAISALDLSLLGLDYDQFEIYDSYPCYNLLIGLDETLEIVKQTISISEPEASSFDLGESSLRLSAEIGGTATKDDIQAVQSQTKTEITNVENRVVTKMASITIDEDQIVSTVTENVQQTISETVNTAIEDIEVGGRNLLLQSDTEYENSDNPCAVYVMTEQMEFKEYVLTLWGALAEGKTHFEAYLDGVTSLGQLLNNQDGTYSMKFIGQSGTLEPSEIHIYAEPRETIATSTIYAVKLEAGNVHTDWEPAPEDVTNAIGTVSQDTGERLDDLQESMEEVDAATEEAQNTANEALQITQTNSSQITELLQTAAGWEFNFEQLETVITELNGEVTTEFTERLKYIKFIDGEIWLGRDPDRGEDDFKLVISNDRIRFLQNNIEVAYVSNEQLYITNAKVLTRLEIGQFAFFPRENGNLTLRYTGGA